MIGATLAWMNALLRLAETRQLQALRLDQLETQNRRLQQQLDAQALPSAGAPDLGQFYVDFEDRFRGERADIKNRLQVYLPRLAHLVGTPLAANPIAVDVGCGRGEWLELMAEQGISALGIDTNADMVRACVARGHAARCDDAVEFLRRQPAGSLALVTGFHIIEHIPLESLIALFDAALAALRPGGMVIFETPNPQNLLVGACTFYTDPTHLRPIVPDVAEFIARQRGFAQAEILPLHPMPAALQLTGGSVVEAVLNRALYSAQDYAVIATKHA